MKSLKKNLSYQTFYQILTTITPLITAPYLARKLGANNLGIYSYTQSIVNYFIYFAMLGFVNYGTRTIALEKDEKKQNIVFCEIYILQVICSIISLLLYVITTLIISNNIVYMILQSFWVISCVFDVTWYFFGKEEYKITVTRNTIIKILTISSILLFVKSDADLWKYTLIMSFGTFVSQFALWIKLKNKVKFENVSLIYSFKKHFKNVITLFIPYLAMSIYHIMDKTMLGAISTYEQSGYYYNSDKVANIPLGILNGLGTVMLSKISSLQVDENTKKQIPKYINTSIIGIMCAAVALGFGIASVSKDFVPLFFGSGYEQCILLVNIFSIIIIFKALTNIVQTQYMIPFKQEKKLTLCVSIGAITNIIANIILIKYMNLGALGATIGTLIAEAMVTTLEVIIINKKIKISQSILKSITFIIFGVIMYFAVYVVSLLNLHITAKLIIEITVGGIVYLTFSIMYLYYIDKDIIKLIKKNKRIKE